MIKGPAAMTESFICTLVMRPRKLSGVPQVFLQDLHLPLELLCRPADLATTFEFITITGKLHRNLHYIY